MSLETTPTHPQANSYVTVAEADAYFSDRLDVSSWSALSTAQKEALLKLASLHIDSLRYQCDEIVPRHMWYRKKQYLKFPRTDQDTFSGSVDSATSTTIVDANLESYASYYPDDFWNAGAIIITEGTGRGQTRKISDYDAETGTITVDTAFSPVPDSTSTYYMVSEVDQRVKHATCEQALYLVNGGGERQKLQSEGVTSYTIGDLSETFGNPNYAQGKIALSNEARGMLKGLYSIVGKIF